MIYDFKFNILEVAGPKVLDLTFRSTLDKANVYVDCPFCGPKGKSKLALYKAKDSWRCNYCDKGGGMLALYVEYFGLTGRDAYKDALREVSSLLDINEAEKGKRKRADKGSSSAAPVRIETPKADPETIHQTYMMLLSSLSLIPSHVDELTKRGLSKSDIERNGYKSVPAFGQDALCQKLLKAGCVLEGVPGFYKNEKGGWSVKLKAPGILIPIRALDGKITAMQIRLNNPINGRKYIWFSSSNEDGGTGSGSPIHFVGDPSAKTIYITEGALKGDVANKLTGFTFACIPGVKSIGCLDDVLLALKNIGGCKEIAEALDIDKVCTTPGKPLIGRNDIMQALLDCESEDFLRALRKNKHISHVDGGVNDPILTVNYEGTEEVYMSHVLAAGKELIAALNKDKPVNFTGKKGLAVAKYIVTAFSVGKVEKAAGFKKALNLHQFNPHVSIAVDRLKDKVAAYGFKVGSTFWEDKTLKGIDDYFLVRWQEAQKSVYNITDGVAAAV